MNFGQVYHPLPPALLETYKDVINTKPHLKPIKERLVLELQKTFQNQRDYRKYSEIARLVDLYHDPATSPNARKAAFITLANGREGFKLVTETVDWQDATALADFAQKYEEELQELFEAAYPDENEREERMDMAVMEQDEYIRKIKEIEERKGKSKGKGKGKSTKRSRSGSRI